MAHRTEFVSATFCQPEAKPLDKHRKWQSVG